MVKLVEVHDISEVQARAIMERDLPPLMQKLIRKAHKEGSKGRPARTDHKFSGSLLDAAICLKDDFEGHIRSCVNTEVWSISFGYTIHHHAPGYLMLHLK